MTPMSFTMSRTFTYLRVSTTEQTTDNQLNAIKQAGYDIPTSRVVAETVSGGVEAMKRSAFANLVENKLEAGDTLVVLKLDRLGRDNIDVQKTVEMLINKGITLICLDLPVKNLSSSEGKLMLQLFSAFAEFEKNRIIERTQDGLNRAKAQGVKLGRPEATKTRLQVQAFKGEGLSQSKVAKKAGISLATVKRHWNV